jgi:SAM-dependent methyltransferase
MRSFPLCPDCSGDAKLIGLIPATDVFAGRSLERPLPGGSLYRCRRCLLGFRWPRLAKDELDALYKGGNETTWSTPLDSRADWHIAREWIAQLVPMGSRILDVGCFDGGFLEPLVDSYQCFGIEIHPNARDRAKRKGIAVIGSDFSEVTGGFDCITALDVIEHMERPRSFLDHCLTAVRPQGWVLVSTGNLDAFSFRVMGSRYWYCTIAEHISFLSPVWFQAIEQKSSCILKQTTFAHGAASTSRRFREAANNVLYRTAPWAFRNLRKLGFGGKSVDGSPELADHPPVWGSARDHFMVLVQKA